MVKKDKVIDVLIICVIGIWLFFQGITAWMYLIFVLLCVAMVVRMMNVVMNTVKKNRMNQYFTYQMKVDGIELHFSPIWFFSYIKRDQFYEYMNKAIDQIQIKHPHQRVYIRTITLRRIPVEGAHPEINDHSNDGLIIISSMISTLSNLHTVLSLTMYKKIKTILTKQKVRKIILKEG